MPEYRAHTGAIHHSTIFISANHKSKIHRFGGTLYHNSWPSHQNNNMEVILFNYFIFCHFISCYTVAVCSNMDDTESD